MLFPPRSLSQLGTFALGAIAALLAACAPSSAIDDAASKEGVETFEGPMMASEIERRVAPCFEEPWADARFQHETSETEFIKDQEGTAHQALDDLGGTIFGGITTIDRLLLADSAGNQILDDLIERLDHQAETQALQSFQRACSAQCVTSRLIDYASVGLQRYGAASDAVEDARGECVEFAKIGYVLMNGIDVDTSVAISGIEWHAYLDVTLSEDDRIYNGEADVSSIYAGMSYYVEPQDDPRLHGCVFYNQH